MTSDISSISNIVAGHYNKLPEEGLDVRNQSKIIYLRNFNNWIKSVLLTEFIWKIRHAKRAQKCQRPFCVLDLGCGKGGDLLKWKRAGIEHLVCVDIASTSVQQAEYRYAEILNRGRGGRIFKGEFITADFTKDLISSLYENPEMEFDLISCQFALHYGFESLAKAERLFHNVSSSLRSGGFFIGTTIDANDVVRRCRGNDGKLSKTANSVFSIEFDGDDSLPLFGAQYMFHLDGVVDCPEFLVHFPTLVMLAEKYGMKLVRHCRFAKYFQKNRVQYLELLQRMKALETYRCSGDETQKLIAEDNDANYGPARKENKKDAVGTMSKDEWDVATLYLVFGFEKL